MYLSNPNKDKETRLLAFLNALLGFISASKYGPLFENMCMI
jgi:hypothetical protein